MSNEEAMVSVPKSEIEALVAQNAELINLIKQQQGANALNADSSLRRKKEKKVTVATIDNKPVVRMVNKGDESAPWFTWTEQDPKNPRKEILLTDLVVLDPKTKTEEVIERVNWLEFMDKGGRKDCKVVKQRGETWEKENGVVTKRTVPDGDHYHMEELDMLVPDIVEGKEYHYVVDFNGEMVELHENYVNMIK